MNRWSLCVGLLLATSSSGCGGADIGEECDEVSSTDECVEGGVCTNDSGGTTCREICEEHVDCAMGFACNGVSGTNIKSCQPDSSKAGP